jgi:hypothetical protein
MKIETAIIGVLAIMVVVLGAVALFQTITLNTRIKFKK